MHERIPQGHRTAGKVISTVSYERGVRVLSSQYNLESGSAGSAGSEEGGEGLFYAQDLKHHEGRRENSPGEEAEIEDLRLYSRYEHSARMERRRVLVDEHGIEPMQITPVFQGIGTHYADVWVGSPTPQVRSVLAGCWLELYFLPLR